MPRTYTGHDFAHALLAGPLQEPLVRVGMVKMPTEDGADASTLLFADGTACAEWIPVPTAMIEEVTHLGMIRCGDHDHPLVQLRFKEPAANNPEARAFAALARRAFAGAHPGSPLMAPTTLDAAAMAGLGPVPSTTLPLPTGLTGGIPALGGPALGGSALGGSALGGAHPIAPALATPQAVNTGPVGPGCTCVGWESVPTCTWIDTTVTIGGKLAVIKMPVCYYRCQIQHCG